MTRTPKGPVLGIDLGTIKSVAAVYEDGQDEPTIIKPHPKLSDYTDPWLPSLVCLTDEEPLVGEPARRYAKNPRSRERSLFIRCVKRWMDYPSPRYAYAGQAHTPAQIASLILKHLREAAARQLDRPLSDFMEGVITVPAYFGQTERMATREAAMLAGFRQVYLLDEPIAAAMGLRVHEESGRKLILVVDLGGGTLDVTLLLAGTDAQDGGIYELSRDGDGRLGGINWDTCLALYALKKKHPLWRQRITDRKLKFLDPSNILLFEPCEKAKREFCVKNPPSVHEFEYVDFTDMRPYDASITHDKFLEVTRDLRRRCVQVCERLLAEVPPVELEKLSRAPSSLLERFWPRRIQRLGWEHIQRIYMVGGGSRVTSVQKEIWDHWKRDGTDPQLADRPELQIAFGAAYYAARIDEYRERPIHGRCPHTIGIWWYPQAASLPSGVHGNGEGMTPRDGEADREFSPIIHKNERTPVARCVDVPISEKGNVFRVELVEQRPAAFQPERPEAGTPALAERHGGVPAFQASDRPTHIELGTLEIRDLRPPQGKRDRKVQLELVYHSDSDMTFRAQLWGKVEQISPTRPAPQKLEQYEADQARM